LERSHPNHYKQKKSSAPICDIRGQISFRKKSKMSFPKYPHYKPSGVDWLGDVPNGKMPPLPFQP
jgi:hypothetical protein